MDLQSKYSDNALEKIVEEAAIYMCTCPGQVASEIRTLRSLIRYQRECLHSGNKLQTVHQTIATSATEAHALMEACLERVLEIEGWDAKSFKMPEGLRQVRDRMLDES